MKIEYAAPSALLPEMPVEIEAQTGDWPGIYASRIESVAGRQITLTAPIQNNVWVPLRPGTPLVVRAGAFGGQLSWDTRVMERRTEPHPVLLVARPARLLVVQRRGFYRVRTQLPVLAALVDALHDPASADAADGASARGEQAAVLLNLSGGGAAVRSTLPVSSEAYLRVRLPLFDRHGELVLAGQVVGVDTRRLRWDTERVARVRWIGLAPRDEDRLVRWVRDLEKARLRDRWAAREF